ncbi:hypothetical protein, partial [Enterococcus durans]
MKVIKVNSHDTSTQTVNFSNGSFISFRLIDHRILQVLKTNISGLSYLASKEISFGMATVFLTNFIRCRTSFRMLFRLS